MTHIINIWNNTEMTGNFTEKKNSGIPEAY